VTNWKMRSAKVVRKVGRWSPPIARAIERGYRRTKSNTNGSALTQRAMRSEKLVGSTFVQHSGRSHTLIRSVEGADERQVGIYLRGACDLPAMFTMAPLIREDIRGSCCIVRDPLRIAGSRSDFLLHALEGHGNPPAEALREAEERLSLKNGYFSARLFDPTFTIDFKEGKTTFPKTVVVLSIAPDYSRTLYRHKEHGFMVDPGGFWLDQSMENVLGDLDRVAWFKKNFQNIGRLTPDQVASSFGTLVRRVQQDVGAHVLVFSLLTVDPSDPIHSYRLAPKADTTRRREFAVALAELSAELDFDIVDIDRILKLGGVTEQVDYEHFTQAQFAPIGAEGYRILKEREIF
jgi:hypothetical protein